MLADVFEKKEKKNKTTSEYRLKKIVVEMAMTKDKKVEWTEHIPRGKDVNDCFTALGWTP